LETLERTFQKERRYDYKFGLKTKDGLKSVQEITIYKIFVQKLIEYCSKNHTKFNLNYENLSLIDR